MKELICPKCGGNEFKIPHPMSNTHWTSDGRSTHVCKCGYPVSVIPHPPKFRTVLINDTDEVK